VIANDYAPCGGYYGMMMFVRNVTDALWTNFAVAGSEKKSGYACDLFVGCCLPQENNGLKN